MTSLIGGATLGQGLHGRTMDVHEAAKGDDDTLYAELASASRSPPWVAWRLGEEAKPPRKMNGAEADALVRSARTATRTVAKRMDEKDAFKYELETVARVRVAYGPTGASEFTTLGALAVGKAHLAAVHVPAIGAYFIFSARCETPLDRYSFDNGADVDEFVRDVLESFARLHAAGMIHGDVKLDNMIRCSAAGRCKADGKALLAGRRYRLIDWGAATEAHRDLPRRYLGGGRSRNTASPLAWFAWGLGPIAGQIAFVQHARKQGSGLSALILSVEFWRLAIGAVSSSERHLARLRRMAAERGGDTSEAAIRALVLEKHWRSFDLYNMGVILGSLAVTTRGGAARRAALLAVAVRLTHYDHPEFCGDDAEAALRHYGALRHGDRGKQ